MKRKYDSLADEVFAAFQRACREDDMEVAEHLLKALEVLSVRDEVREDVRRICDELLRQGITRGR